MNIDVHVDGDDGEPTDRPTDRPSLESSFLLVRKSRKEWDVSTKHLRAEYSNQP